MQLVVAAVEQGRVRLEGHSAGLLPLSPHLPAVGTLPAVNHVLRSLLPPSAPVSPPPLAAPSVLADEVGRSLYEELDFRVEAANAAEFRRAHAYIPFITGA